MERNLHKRIITLNTLVILALQMFAQGLEYYKNADGKKERELKTALAQIINNHTQLTYNGLWQAYYTTDVKDGKIWDMYSNTTSYTPGTDQVGQNGNQGSKEGDGYNREHSMPKSWFNDEYPMYTDLVHVIPTDGWVNSGRGNNPFGETSNPSNQSSGGFSKWGPSSISGYTGTVFEPNDEYKGDFARIYFYMVTCYEDKVSTWKSDMLANNAYPAFTEWAQDMLLRWANEDPVSQKEIDRNEAVYKLQGNRNPYVDYPGLEQYVWGDKKDVIFNYDNYTTGITVVVPTKKISDVDVYTITGIKVRSGVSKNKATDGLSKGIYIIGNKKYIVK